MKYAYPAIFTPTDDGYDVYFPDLFGCRTCADTLPEAVEMAEDAAETWLLLTEKEGGEIPASSVPSEIAVTAPQIVSIVKADTEAYRRRVDSHAVKKTLTIPAWLNYEAEAANINFSNVLQDALKARLEA
jgi:predicted RNase H-like HicB family nuclease